MALLDALKKIPQRIGKNLERNIGGLLGESLDNLSEDERRAIRRQAATAIFDAMASGTTPTANLERVAAMAGARLEAQRGRERQSAAEALLPGIAGRVYGGQSLKQIETAPGLDPASRLTSRYRKDPEEAMAILSGTRAGLDAAQISPGLVAAAQEGMKPEEYVYQNVPGVGLVAVNRRNPNDRRVVQREVRQPREAPQPTLRQVRLANGMVQDTWIAPGQASGTPVGAPYMPGTGKGGEGETLNARQQSGVNMTQDAAYTYAANITGVGVEELKKKTPAEIETLIRNKGGRFLQGGVARTVSGLPVIGDFAKTIVEASNADLMGPATTGGSGIAMLQNPTGPITGTDVEVGIRQFPNPMLPVNVQAQMIRSILERGGRVERYDRSGNPIK
jgi:hypothetical protein